MRTDRLLDWCSVAASLLTCTLVLAPSRAVAQTTTGTILGTVTDSSGAVLPGATVTITSPETGQVHTVVTGNQGRYRLPQLSVGTYDVQAELMGFQSQVRRNLPLTVGGEMVIDFALGLGGIEEVIEVTSEAPMVQTTSTEVGALVDERMIRSLPLNARDIQQLAILQPGVQQNNYHNFGTQMVVSGTRPQNNRFLLNGVDTTFSFTTSPVSAAGIMMGVEAVQEFKLLVGQYSAAYGEKSGGVLNTVTKAGTNEFHGSVYEFHRNDKFDAKNYFDQGDPPPFNRNQFGVSIGGPIVRGRSFFFANFEGFRQRLGLSHLAVVPDDRAREGYLPDPANPGGEIHVGIAPQVQPYLALFPKANGRSFGDGTAQFFSNPKQEIDEHYFTTRLDHRLSDADSLYGVYTGDWSEEFTPTQNPNFADHRTYNKHIFSAQNIHTFSPNLINTTRVGFNKSYYFFRTDTLVDVDRSLYFVPDPFYAPTDNGQFGVVSITGLKGLGQTSTGVNITPRWFDYRMLSLNSDFNYLRGAHSWQFGFLYKRTWDDTVVANPNSRGNFTFLSLRSFMQGQPRLFSVYVPDESVLERNWRHHLFGAYVEDSIRLRNLTLNLGVRYETLVGPSEANGRVSNLRGGFLDPAPTVGKPYFKQPRNLISPRAGFNWDPSGDGRVSIRGGGAIFYDQINNWYYFLQAPGSAPFSRNVTLINPPFPNALAAIPPTSLPDFNAVQYDAKAPTKYSFDLTMQRELGGAMSLMVAYVGSQSRNNGRSGNQNLYEPEILPDGTKFWPAGLNQRPNPNFRQIGMIIFDARTSYNSFQATLERRSAQGLAFRMNYTFAKCTDDISNEFGGGSLNGGSAVQDTKDRASSRGPCSFNAEQTVNITTTWNLPGRNLQGIAGALFGNWQWSTITTIQSGMPFELGLGFHNSRQGQLGSGPDRPNWAPGCDADNAIQGGPDQYFDPMCFVPAEPGFLGNVPSRVLRGPGLLTSDWSLAKTANLGNGRRLEIRAEVFNVFNRSNFAVPASTLFQNRDTRIGSAGLITRTITPSRQAQFGVKFMF